MKQGTANLAEDYCFIHKALRPVSKAPGPRRQIATVPPSNSRPASGHSDVVLRCVSLCSSWTGVSELNGFYGRVISPGRRG